MYVGYFWRISTLQKVRTFAVRLIGLVFVGKGFSMCHKCGEKSVSLTEHILFNCARVTISLGKLIARIGFDLHTNFISLSDADQVNSLLSGVCDMLNVERNRVDSMKMFLVTLKLLVWGNGYENKIIL